MSETESVVPIRKRRNRSPSVAKPAFIVVQILGDDGQPVDFDKKKMRILAVERDPNKMLEMIDENQHPNAFYLRVIVPVARVQQPRKAAAE